MCACRFHEALANLSVQAARRVGVREVLLTGGVFQNRRLTERCVTLLNGAGFSAHTHHQVPPNDGGIAYGQLIGGTYVFSRTRKNTQH
jgi:hydrogenase maturation protein HypF